VTIIDVRDLEERTRAILRQVEEGETIEVVDGGKPVAKLVPFTAGSTSDESRYDESRYDEMSLDDLIEELDKYWPKGVGAVEAVQDVRGEL